MINIDKLLIKILNDKSDETEIFKDISSQIFENLTEFKYFSLIDFSNENNCFYSNLSHLDDLFIVN